MANVKLGTKIFEGVEAVKLDTTDGSTVTFGGSGSNVKTCTVTESGATVYNAEIGVFMSSGDPEYLYDGDQSVLEYTEAPNEVVFNGVPYNVSEITTEDMIYGILIGNASLINAFTLTSYEDNGLDFLILGPAIITRSEQDFVMKYIWKATETRIPVYDKTFKVTRKTYGTGTNPKYHWYCDADDFPTGLSKDYKYAYVSFDESSIYQRCNYVCKLTQSDKEIGFGDDRVKNGDGSVGVFTPFYVSVNYADANREALDYVRIFAAEQAEKEHHIKIDFAKLEAV